MKPPPLRPLVANDVRGLVSEIGTGPPVVLLASQLVLERSYRPTQDALRRDFRVMTVEWPGTGVADPLPTPWGFDEYARWLIAALEVLNAGPVTLIGHSNSGAAALRAAVLVPRLVSGLVLVGTIGADPWRSLTRVLIGRTLDAGLEAQLTATGWPHIATNILRHPRNFVHQVWNAARADLRADAVKVTVPTLLAWGALDLTMPPRCARLLHRLIPGAELYVSTDGSHDWLITHADEFAAAVRDSCRRNTVL